MCQSALNLTSLISVGLDHIDPPDLIVVSGTTAQVRIHRNGPASAECRIRIVDVNVVVDITEIKAVLVVGVFVHANDVLAQVQRVREVKR